MKNTRFILCVNNQGYPASLEVRKLYERIEDKAAIQHGLLRVVDESGEDYLYPENLFRPVGLAREVEEVL